MKLTTTLSGLAAAALLIPGIGFFFAPFTRSKPIQWERVGKIADFKVGTTTLVTLSDPSPLVWAGVIAKTAAWLRRKSENEFLAFSVNCTHLGCPVRWEAKADLFLCPCHGGVYTEDGKVAGGPPPRPLIQYEVRTEGEYVEILMTELPIA